MGRIRRGRFAGQVGSGKRRERLECTGRIVAVRIVQAQLVPGRGPIRQNPQNERKRSGYINSHDLTVS